MNPRERLQAARQATLDGRHEDALRDLLWFHEHALAQQPALYGVRLSLALCYWVDLGKLFAPARQALEDVRERKTLALLRGEGDCYLFHDVLAIHDFLGRSHATYALYRQLAERQPELARHCAGMALPAIVAAGDFQLAHRIRSDPEARIRNEAARLGAAVLKLKQLPYSPVPRRGSLIAHYAGLVRRHLDITAGIGDHAQARRLHALALGLLPNPSLREAVRRRIARPAAPPPRRRRRPRALPF